MAEFHRPNGQMEVLSELQCVELLASSDLGRIGLAIDGQPEIFPINYASDGKVVVFRTARGTRPDQATVGRIAFEVDGWDEQTGIGWSVLLKGVAQEVTTGQDPFASALRERPVRPLAPGERELWIAVYPAEISGRRFRKA